MSRTDRPQSDYVRTPPGGVRTDRTRRIVLCVDDLGAHPAVADAVITLLDAGLVGAAGALVDGPDWPAAAARLRERPVDLGLHFNLTQDWATAAQVTDPVAPLGRLLREAWLRRLPPARLRAAIDRQLEAFVQAVGRRPDFIDGHQHIQQWPGIREALVERIQAWWPQSEGRPWLRVAATAGWSSAWLTDPKAQAKAAVIAGLGGARWKTLARAAGCPVNPAFTGVYGFGDSAAAYALRCDAWLRAAPDGTLWMTHPATQRLPGDPIAAARVAEFEALRPLTAGQGDRYPGLRFVRGSDLFKA